MQLRFARPLIVSALGLLTIGGCSGKAHTTPPLYAPLPARNQDLEGAPRLGRLPLDVHPLGYQLTLDIDPRKPKYKGEVKIEIALDRPRETLWLHNRGPSVLSAQVVRHDGQTLVGTVEQVDPSGLTALHLKQPLGAGVARIELTFESSFGERLTGLYRAQAGGQPYAFSQFEPTSAREAFPCFDEPRFKTPYSVQIVASREHTAITNTREVSSTQLMDGRVQHQFASTEKLPSYLLAFAVGPFDVVNAPPVPVSQVRARELPLRGVSVQGRGKDLSYALGETPKIVAALERYFGSEYPYDKLDLIAVPDFGAGAMENAGAITFRDTLLLLREDATEGQVRSLANVNAHELAHQWFGNLVTMPWWDDVWLNEAFATWMATRVVSELYPEHNAELGELSYTHYAMEVDSQAAARQVRQPIKSDHDIENAFDAITYAKGGAVLSMFERYLGKEPFQAGLQLYMKKHRFGNATADDLMAALSEASKRPELKAAFNTFLEQPGVPLVEAKLDCTGKPFVTLTQHRYGPVGATFSAQQSWQIPVCMRFAQPNKGPATEQCVLLTSQSGTVELNAEACPRWLLPNSAAAGYYRFFVDDQALTGLMASLSELTEAEQLSLSQSMSSAFNAGKVDAAQLLPALEKLAQLPSRHLLTNTLSVLATLREKMLDANALEGYRLLVTRIASAPFAKLGLYPKGGETSGEDKLLRATVARALVLDAKEPTLTKELAVLGRALLNGDNDERLTRLPTELHELALSAALRTGDGALLQQAMTKLKNESDGTVRGRLLSAISRLDRPELTNDILTFSLDPALRTNERIGPLFGQSARNETRETAFKWLQQHYQELIDVLGDRHKADVMGATGGFCSEERAAQVAALFGPMAAQLPGGPRELALALESIRLCAALEAAQGAGTRSYFGTLAKAQSIKAPVTKKAAH